MLLLTVGFYAFFSVPYWNKSIIWRDIEISGLKLKENGPQYRLSNGILYKENQSRKIKFELNPAKLIENDQVLRLALFYQITKEDPLFVGPGLDANVYKTSVNELERVNSELLINTGFKENVVPITFLKKTVEVMDSENTFANNKSLFDAETLMNKYKEANRAYLKEAKDLRKKMNDKKLPQKELIQFASITSPDIITADLDKIIKNSSYLNENIIKKGNCLKISTYFCERSLLASANRGETTSQVIEAEPKILNNSQIYIPTDSAGTKLSGPYEVSSTCFNRNNPDTRRFLYTYEDTANGVEKLFPVLAENNYYQKIAGVKTDTVVNSAYLKHDLNWIIALLTTSYGCNDLIYQPKLATIDAYFKRYNKDRIFSRMQKMINADTSDNLKNMIGDGREAENTFFDNKYPSEQDLDNLAVKMENVYAYIVTDQNSTQNSSLDYLFGYKEELLSRSLYIYGKQGNFERVLGTFSFHLNGYANTYKLNKGDREAYIYYIRSGYPLTYLGFSPYVWKSKDTLDYINKETSKIRPDFKDYYEMVKEFGQDYVNRINDIKRPQIWQELLGESI